MDEHEYEVRCAGEAVAWTSGTQHDALRDARHYAAIYAKDGPTEIYEVHKTYALIPAE